MKWSIFGHDDMTCPNLRTIVSEPWLLAWALSSINRFTFIAYLFTGTVATGRLTSGEVWVSGVSALVDGTLGWDSTRLGAGLSMFSGVSGVSSAKAICSWSSSAPFCKSWVVSGVLKKWIKVFYLLLCIIRRSDCVWWTCTESHSDSDNHKCNPHR